MRGDDTHSSFSTTHWTLLSDLHAAEAPKREAARAALIARTWPAVYSWLRRSGHRAEAAAETTQAFFVEVVLGRSLFEKARAERGRLRSWLLAALRNYITDMKRREAVDPSRRPIGLDDLHAEERRVAGGSPARNHEPAGPPADPGAEFDHRWAISMLNEALRRCETHFSEHGRNAHWRIFEARVLVPAARACEAPALDALLAGTEFKSAAAAAAAVQTVKKRLLAILRDVVAETVTAPEHTEHELAAITALLEGRAASA